MRLSDLELNSSATLPSTSQPTLPEIKAPSFPIRFSLTGKAQRERLTLPGHDTGIKMSFKTAAHIQVQRHTDMSKTKSLQSFQIQRYIRSKWPQWAGIALKMIKLKKSNPFRNLFFELLCEHPQIWRWDCPGLYAICRNILKAVKRHKNLYWG